MAPAEPPVRSILKVLVVDDSAFARKIVREMLIGDPSIDVVGSARDGEEALAMTASMKPDLVICDLHMPNLKGVEFVRRQMRIHPLPILIVSSASQDAAEVVEALSLGAVDVVTKPSALATDDLRAIRTELVEKLWTAASASSENLAATAAEPAAPKRPENNTDRYQAVVIGISTGGPQALLRVIPKLSASFPLPVAVVLHMPVGYTALYARSLGAACALDVREARDGDVFAPGTVLIAQAGRHLCLRREEGGTVVARLAMKPMDKLHRPSADVLFRSAAETYGSGVLAVVMTGMGDDGKEGAAWVKAKGGTVLTEDEKSCVIYGMPRSVKEAGLSDASVALEDIAQAIISRI
jgi:two-component system chemotaxis response regulator CheB